MQNFVFDLPTRVVFGPGSVDLVGRQTAPLGTHVLIVTGSTFARRSGLVERIRASLREAGVDSSLYDELEQNPTVEAVDRGGAMAREVGADVILGIGGGSALDAAKAIALVTCSGISIWSYTRHARGQTPEPVRQALPIVQVPIIASTGSETNQSAVVLDAASGIKAPVSGPSLFARVAIVDPALTYTVPAHFTAVGAMNIVSQMLENYLTGDEFAVTDRITEGLVRAVMDSVARASRNPDDLDARSNLCWAATMASTAATAGRAGHAPLRALAHPLTARYGLEHGSALAALWPSFMRYALANRARLPQIGRFKRYALLGRQLFGVHETDDEVAAETTAYRFVHWLRNTGMPADLRGVGIDMEDLNTLADQVVVVSGDGERLPGGLTVQDIENIYEGALRPVPVGM